MSAAAAYALALLPVKTEVGVGAESLDRWHRVVICSLAYCFGRGITTVDRLMVGGEESSVL
jgi:hypothetical protein